MINIAVCCNDPIRCSDIENKLSMYSKEVKINLNIEVWYNGEELCRYLSNGNIIDILFLDIESNSVEGIEIGIFIRHELGNYNIQIIYISSELMYTQKIFKTQPTDFIIRPITDEKIKDAMIVAQKILKKRNKYFKFNSNNESHNVLYDDILYFSSDARKINIITIDGYKSFYGKLKDISELLAKEFVIIHKSYIINKKYIVYYTYESVRMSNGDILPISKSYRKMVRHEVQTQKKEL